MVESNYLGRKASSNVEAWSEVVKTLSREARSTRLDKPLNQQCSTKQPAQYRHIKRSSVVFSTILFGADFEPSQ